jgi:hypothetical protein
MDSLDTVEMVMVIGEVLDMKFPATLRGLEASGRSWIGWRLSYQIAAQTRKRQPGSEKSQKFGDNRKSPKAWKGLGGVNKSLRWFANGSATLTDR